MEYAPSRTISNHIDMRILPHPICPSRRRFIVDVFGVTIGVAASRSGMLAVSELI